MIETPALQKGGSMAVQADTGAKAFKTRQKTPTFREIRNVCAAVSWLGLIRFQEKAMMRVYGGRSPTS